MPDSQIPQPKGWHNRGYLPHFDGGEISQLITLHLGDAMPQAVWRKWKLELQHEKDESAKIALYHKFNNYLDKGYGKCYLRNREIAETVEESLLHHDSIRYKLLSWVIMPNHIHFMIRPIEPLSEIMKKFKSYTAHEANKLLRRNGKFWQEDYHDRFIRNYEHYENALYYIERNPVKARLCEKASDWKFGSARRRKKDELSDR